MVIPISETNIMEHIFISHSSQDKPLARLLCKALESQGLSPWEDSLQLRGGDLLRPEIQEAIESAQSFILVLSPATFQSAWVKHELEVALEFKKKRKDYRVVPLLRAGMKREALKWIFPEEPVGIMLKSGPGAINEAMPELLSALGKTLPNHVEPMQSMSAEPMEELMLELSEPKIIQAEGKRRATATAKLMYLPAESGAPPVEGATLFEFTAPIGPIEMEELRWYLERYAIWPVGTFKERARAVEQQLPQWGKLLHDKALPQSEVLNVLQAWVQVQERARRRFTISVKESLRASYSEEEKKEAKEAATLLLALPWELLHDGNTYLFQGAEAVRVRRQLPNTKRREVLITEPPIRILLVSPRPEDEKAAYIDHRVSALPLVGALEQLGKLAELTVLHPPTFPALCEELKRAMAAKTPYHVVHFDGHGIYNKEVGLGGLCFEDPQDVKKLQERRSEIIYAEKLSEVLRDHRIPLVFLEACQTAQAEESPTASVAASLLNQGVASVVAMSHSVLVETARRFVETFYKTLVQGERVGDAMLQAQQQLKADSFRMKVFGAGELRMEDWFVPVLFQEKDDPQLFKQIPSEQIQAIDQKALENRLGKLPPPPEHTFIGRSRDLLQLERLLSDANYAVICGQGGEGKTTLAAELARWLVRSSHFERTVFVSVEHYQDARSVLDQIGQQLINNYSVAHYQEGELFDRALQPIERALQNEKTLILLDNMETILPPPQDAENSLDSLKNSLYEPEVLAVLFQLCQKLLKVGNTSLLFTSRESLPEPFHFPNRTLTLQRLDKKEAIELVKQAMTQAGLTPEENDIGETQPEIEALVESVNCHARSLALLAPQIQHFGVQHTTQTLIKLMRELDHKSPNDREKSLFASIELSLHRLPKELREKLPILGLFHGGAHLSVLAMLLEMGPEEITAFANALTEIGLAEMKQYGHLSLHPALCPYLFQELDTAVLPALQAQWTAGMKQLADWLLQQRYQNSQLSATLILLELPNLLAFLAHVQSLGEAETTVDIATTLEGLLQSLGRPRILKKVVAIRETESQKLEEWSHVRFTAAKNQVERLLESGNLSHALQQAQQLLEKTQQAGEQAYPGAAYDCAFAFILLGRVLRFGGAAGEALAPLVEAQRRFEKLAEQGSKNAAGMASITLSEQGECLSNLGRLDEATAAYENCLEIPGQIDDARSVAIGKFQLGTVRYRQKKYQEALEIYQSVLKQFEALGEPNSVAGAWHHIGMVYQSSDNFDASEHAYRQALAIQVQQKNQSAEALSLIQLGNLYSRIGRLEEAVAFYKQSAEIYLKIQDQPKEGISRNNLADKLIKLKCYAEARQEIQRAIQCKEPYGHAAIPWSSWNILCNLEQAEGNLGAAQQARQQAMALFLAYRRDGGENHESGGRVCSMVGQAIQQQQTEKIEQTLAQLANHPELSSSRKALITALQAILSGSRDPALAQQPDLYYMDAVELQLLLEGL